MRRSSSSVSLAAARATPVATGRRCARRDATPLVGDVCTLRDSTPLIGDARMLRARARGDGCLLLRGLPGPEAVAPLRGFVQEVCAALGLLRAARADRFAPVTRTRAAFTGTGYDDPRWLALQQRVLADARFIAVGDHPRLLGVLEVLLGEPPLARRGDICRVALPGAPHLTTPPHQDHWYTGGTINLWTAWVALTDTPLELGPLAVLSRSHSSGLLPHCGQGAGRQCVQLRADAKFAAAPLAAGDAILFHSLTVHRALANVTRDRVRLSVDYRYQAATEPLHAIRVDGTRAGELNCPTRYRMRDCSHDGAKWRAGQRLELER